MRRTTVRLSGAIASQLKCMNVNCRQLVPSVTMVDATGCHRISLRTTLAMDPVVAVGHVLV